MSIKEFQILGKLGEGAFSSVWKAKRISDGQEYAMKKVKLASLSEKEKQNALNEVRILASIKSPFIVGYKEAFFEDNSMTLCIVMEYAGGGDILNKITKHQKTNSLFKEQDIWRFAIQMVMGLKVLHDMKILHRDLKCANIFLSTDGTTAKLGDLNVSKVAKTDLVYTQTGTPYYASPEVWRDQPYDSKSDIWSLGCVIYEMCALKPPFRANDMQGLFKKVQRGIFDRIPTTYSIDLYNFISMCLQVKPSLRPNCDQLLSHPIIQRNGGQFLQSLAEFDESNELLGTILLPKNIRALAQKLPKANYEEEPSPSPNGLERGRNGYPDEVKDAGGAHARRPISQNAPISKRGFLIRESQSRESRISAMQKMEPIAQKESEKDYLARMQREYIDKAKAMKPVELYKDQRSPKGPNIPKSPTSKIVLSRKEVSRPYDIDRQREENSGSRQEASRNYSSPDQKPKSRGITKIQGNENIASRNEGGAPSQILQRVYSREKSRGEMGVERMIVDKQEYLIHKYQNRDDRGEERKVISKVQSDKGDILLRKADYLIQKYQSEAPKRDISSREDLRRVAGTPSSISRNTPGDILDRYKNGYNLRPVSGKEPANNGQPVPTRKVDYQYLNQNNILIKKNPTNIEPQNNRIKPQPQVKVSVKPQWWG